jgi:hypothetical protein
VRTQDLHRSRFELEDLMQVITFLGENIRSKTNTDHDLPLESDRGWSKVTPRSVVLWT